MISIRAERIHGDVATRHPFQRLHDVSVASRLDKLISDQFNPGAQVSF